MLLSVVIPTFNSDKTIEKCLESLINQTHQNFEICVIDGASTDETLNKVIQFRPQFKNIRIISEADNGVYDAMNKGINIAKGEWIYFLGSDDELYSQDIFSQIFSDPLNVGYHIIYGNVLSPLFNGIYNGRFDADMLYRVNICHQSIFIKKSVFEKVGLFDTKYKILADWEHNTRWFYNRTIKKKYIDSVIANYSDGGLSSSFTDPVLMSDWSLINLRRGFFQLKNKTRIELLWCAGNYYKTKNFAIYLLLMLARIYFNLLEAPCSFLNRAKKSILLKR